MDFETLVSVAINLNKKRRENLLDIKLMLSNLHYAREYCTVTINLGRMTGKTRYIKRYARKGDVVILHDYRQASHWEDFKTCLVFANGTIVDRCGKDAIIWVDNASLFSKENLLEITRAYCSRQDVTFVFLG